MLRKGLSYLWRDILWFLMRLFVGLPLRFVYRIESRGARPFPPRGEPALLLANHPSALDPLTVSIFVKRPICYVVGDDNLRFWAFRMLVNWIKVIPKTKFIPDIHTMRILLERVKDGQIIGIAPEGGRNWDGETLSLNETIPRLVRKLKLPLICIKHRGAYLTWPRWSTHSRRGKIIQEFNYLFKDPREIPEDEKLIAEMIEAKLGYSEMEDPEITSISFAGRNIAEHLELRLWLCPQCSCLFTLKSHGLFLSCASCGANWKFSGNGRFFLTHQGSKVSGESKTFSRYIDWVRFNDARTLPMLLELKKSGQSPLVTIPASLWSGSARVLRNRSFTFQGEGKVILTPDFKMKFTRSRDNSVLVEVPLVETQGAHIAKNDRFEFFLEGNVYRFTFAGQSAYFWRFLTNKLLERSSTACESPKNRSLK